MIIGNNNNNNNFTSNFDERFKTIQEESKKNKNNSTFIRNTQIHTNVNSKKEMIDKSFSMLQERLNNGLITLEEFNKKCKELNKRR